MPLPEPATAGAAAAAARGERTDAAAVAKSPWRPQKPLRAQAAADCGARGLQRRAADSACAATALWRFVAPGKLRRGAPFPSSAAPEGLLGDWSGAGRSLAPRPAGIEPPTAIHGAFQPG